MKNLRKLFVTAIAVAASSMAFAGNTYDVKDLVTGFFSFTEQMPTTELTPEEQMAVNTAKALEKGLLTYAENLSKRELTATDRKIDTTLNTQIPAIFNKHGSKRFANSRPCKPIPIYCFRPRSGPSCPRLIDSVRLHQSRS